MYQKNDYIQWDIFNEEERMNIVGDSIIVWFSYYNISEEEIYEFENEYVEFGVNGGMGVLTLGAKIGNSPWLIFNYNYHHAKHLGEIGDNIFIEPTVEELKISEALKVKIYLVDTGNKKVCSKRVFELPENMKEFIVTTLKHQKEGIIPIINSDFDGDKIALFHCITNFLDFQSTGSIVNNMLKVKFK